MSVIYARKKPFPRLAMAAVVMVAALGMAAYSGGASISSSSSSGAQAGDRSPKQIKEVGEIIIGTSSDKAPLGYIDTDGKFAGYDVAYGDHIATDLSATAKHVSVDTAARTEVLVSNKVDIALVDSTITSERTEGVDFADPYFKVSLGVVSSTSAEITDVSQSASRTLIVTKGTTTEAYSEVDHPKVKLQKYDQYSDACRALEDGRGDALSTDNIEVTAWVTQCLGFNVSIRNLGEASYIAAAAKKGNTALLDWLNNQLVELGQESFFHKDYEQALIPVCGDATTPDDFVVEDGVDTTSTN